MRRGDPLILHFDRVISQHLNLRNLSSKHYCVESYLWHTFPILLCIEAAEYSRSLHYVPIHDTFCHCAVLCEHLVIVVAGGRSVHLHEGSVNDAMADVVLYLCSKQGRRTGCHPLIFGLHGGHDGLEEPVV